MKKTMLFSLMAIFALSMTACKKPAKAENDEKPAVTEKVQLDFHIMSKCPFGVKVLEAVAPVLDKMGDNVDFNVYYIGREKDGKPTSMHGDDEVKGNILQLCAKEVGGTKPWLEFLKCQNADWRKIPAGWESCATKAQIDVAKMKACYEGDQGTQLVLASMKVSEEKKATGSPTIYLADERYSGGRTEAAFARALCGKFQGAKPEYCTDIPEPTKIPVTVIGDQRCNAQGCDPRRFLSFISNTFEGAEVTTLDWADEKAKALFAKTGEQYLPVAIFDAAVEKEESGYQRLSRRLKKLDSGEFVYPLGQYARPPWDPNAEVCDDGIDNTGNGLIDCADPTCQGKKVCRDEIKNKVNLFVMSQCPYGVRTVDAMKEVLEAFGKDRKKIDFTIEFIGKNNDGVLGSMHGDGEVQENLRQICAQKIYGAKYKYMDYVLCRNTAFTTNRGKEEPGAWEACATGGISAQAIRKCAEGPEGQKLLADSFALAESLGLTGSPSWLLNNRLDMNGRTPEQIKAAFCAQNPGTAGCEKTLSAAAPGAPVPAGSCGGN